MWDSHVVVTCEGLAALYANYSRLIFVNYWGRFASKWLSWYFCILKHQCDLYKDKPSIITDVSHVCTNLNRFHCWHLVCTNVQTHDATWLSFLLFYYYYFFPKNKLLQKYYNRNLFYNKFHNRVDAVTLIDSPFYSPTSHRLTTWVKFIIKNFLYRSII